MAAFVHLPVHSTTRFLSFSPSKIQALNPPSRTPSIKASTSSEPEKESKLVQTAGDASPPSSQSSPPPRSPPKKPKGQIVRVDKEKYLNSINYLSVDHPPYYKGLDYIYEDRGEILDLKIFETGEYALVAWVGIPTAPAWLPTYMLIKSDKLDYERL
ncbi:putative NAD(P)H-quinone oxidoreductase subunit O [Dioscorea sansibarensis]